MKKIYIISFIVLLLSCEKKESKLIIYNNETYPGTSIRTGFYNSEVDVFRRKGLINITSSDTLQIWARSDGAPGMFLDENGELQGFFVELEKEIMRLMGQKYELNSYDDVSSLIQKVKTGQAHSVLSTQYLPDFTKLGNFSDLFTEHRYVIFTNSNVNTPNFLSKAEGIKYLNGKNVGVQTRGHIYQLLRYNREINIVEYTTTTKALEALHKGYVDAVLDIKHIGEYYMLKNSWDIDTNGFIVFNIRIGTAFSNLLDRSIVDRYNIALNTLMDSGYITSLKKKYYPQ